MSLATFHIEIFSKYKEPLASHGITYERYERYGQAVESYALEKSRKLSRCEIIMCNDLPLDDDFYEDYAEGGTIILKGLSLDPNIITGFIHDIELAINLYSYRHSFNISSREVQAQLDPLKNYLLTYY